MNISRGFTIIELLIVIGMTAIFAGFTAIVSTPAVRNAEFDRVRETVRNELATAQADTIGGTLDASWGVAFSSNSITRYRGANYATRNIAFDHVTTFGNGVVLSGATDVAFVRPTGLPMASASIVMSDGSLHATTTINAAGAIEIQ